jgi:hypothetical protein
MEEYKEGEFCYGGGKAVTSANRPLRLPSRSGPGWAQKLPARQEDPVIAVKRKLGVKQFEKTRTAFALHFLKEEVGAHRQMGGRAIP